MVLPFVEDLNFYSRKDSVLIATKTNGESIPLVKLKQKFIDLDIVSDSALQYMKDYMQHYPNLFELIDLPKKETEQLTLF